jgi:hypothetical protein
MKSAFLSFSRRMGSYPDAILYPFTAYHKRQAGRSSLIKPDRSFTLFPDLPDELQIKI